MKHVVSLEYFSTTAIAGTNINDTGGTMIIKKDISQDIMAGFIVFLIA